MDASESNRGGRPTIAQDGKMTAPSERATREDEGTVEVVEEEEEEERMGVSPSGSGWQQVHSKSNPGEAYW